MIIEENSSPVNFDSSLFTREELRDMVDQCIKEEMPDWEFYLMINGLTFFLRLMKKVNLTDSLITDMVCSYQKKDHRDYGREEVELYNKFNRYLQSPKWKRICNIILERDHKTCTGCGSNENLNCYHIHYFWDVLFNESEHMDQLTTLCRDCYKETHSPIKGKTDFD